jgi:flagellin-like protein
MKDIQKNNKGASEIVGALLLIAVVIVAVSGIAVIVAQVQKNEMERQSTIDAVEKENIKIMSIKPVLNDTTDFLDALNITITNLNSVDSRITTIVINDKAALNYTSADPYDAQKINLYSYTDRLTVPAGKATVLSINFSTNYDPPYNVSPRSPLKVSVLTENGNIFSKIYQPPTPVIKTSIETENLGVAERDLLFLDGSDSFDDGSVLSYVWRMYSFNGTDYNPTAQYSGKKVKAAINQTNDVYLDLTVSDDNDMLGVSEKVRIPYDMNFNPAVRVNASKTSYNYSAESDPDTTISVSVYDVYGRPLENAAVLFIGMLGNVTVSPTSDVTDATGLASTTITGGAGTVEIKVGKIEKYVSVA